MRPDEPAWGQFLHEVDSFLGEDVSTQGPREVHD
jgi:hypothetical protein